MGKGPDQGDFETPPTDTVSETAGAATDPADTASPTPSDAATTVSPGFDDQLPTTSGADATALGTAIGALVLIAAGLTLAVKRRRRPHW